jgi:hypothetical protein
MCICQGEKIPHLISRFPVGTTFPPREGGSTTTTRKRRPKIPFYPRSIGRDPPQPCRAAAFDSSSRFAIPHGRFRRALLLLPPLAGVQEAALLPSPPQVPASPALPLRIAVAPPVASSGGEGRSGGPLRAVPLGPAPRSHHRAR